LIEAERLQGLPDGHTAVPFKGKRAKDSPRYRAIGNGWCIPVVAWIFRRLDLVERELKEARDG
jgi:DNA (cytosine-5)-methyltransferase 1